MVTKFLNIDTDNTLSANSNERVPSQKAVKTYTDNLTTSKQNKVLDTPIIVESTEETTVEGALGAINTSLSNKQNQSLSSAITVDGTQQTTVEGTLNALNIYANSKQNNLTAGDNITINNNVISAKDTTYIAGTGISIDEDSDENLVISNTQTSAEWGNITGTLSNHTDLQTALNSKYDASNPNGFITAADLPTNYVTTDTTQNISARKTFLGEKAIYFKQETTTNKLGFTLYDPNNTELGALEYRPNTINGGGLLNINMGVTSSNYVGFRYWASGGASATNIVAPKAGANYYIPVKFTDGTSTVSANSSGEVDLSSIYKAAIWGDITGTLSDQTDLQNALNAKQDTLVSGTNIKTVNGNSLLGSGNVNVDTLPSQTGQSGKFLTTDGTDASWADIPDSVIPDNITIDLNESDEIQTIAIIDQKTSSANKFWTGTKAEYDAILVKDPNTTYRTTDEDESVIYENNYHIGQIFKSLLPLDTYGLHLLDGALLYSDGIYSDFVSYITGLYAADPTAAYFTDEASWQASVTTYGVCGKFVYDGVNHTVRLPKVTGFIEGTIDSTALGDLVEAGLPNITGTFTGFSGSTGAISSTTSSIGSYNPGGGTLRTNTLDASKVSSIYGNASTVQPQSIKAYVYIVVANSYQTPVGMSLGKLADNSLTNLTNIGKNIANWSSNVSNCITKIPQDITLELNSGTIILKAGSKVYVPNGFETDGVTPKFDAITISSDVSAYFAGVDRGQCMVFYQVDANTLGWYRPNECSSGTSQTNAVFYNTSTNTIKFVNENQRASLPLGIIFESNGSGITATNQVFNGFGYIGSIVYALPGIKGQAPNGRNIDGSLNNNEINVSNVITAQVSSYNAYIIVSNNTIYLYDDTVTTYRHDENRLYDDHTSVYIPTDRFVAGRMIQNSGVVSSITTKQIFHSLDYNDSDLVAHWAMPSEKYIDLTRGASGTTYTAPANGYYYVNTVSYDGNPAHFVFINNTKSFVVQNQVYSSYGSIVLLMPVTKNDSVGIQYGNIGTTIFRFYYAEGSKSLA